MITPIETRYAGCHFRSRLEARWAVFFNSANIPWEYEPEGFNIDGKYYLPDFRLPQCGLWIEVKPILPTPDILHLLRRAATALGGLMLVGSIPQLLPTGNDIAWRLLGLRAPLNGNPEPEDQTVGFGLYHKNNRPWWMYGNNLLGSSELHAFDRDEYMSEHITAAYIAARSARFEHGAAV
jgi:hypothetical protein